MIQIKQCGRLSILMATEGYLHRKGTDTYMRTCCMLVGDSPDNYEEVPEIPTAPPDDYPERVEAAIRQRYSLSDELAILRQRDTKPEEFAAYNAYAEECKERAKHND